MIATKTTTLLVTMAVLGIVPVAAHAQPVSIEDLIAQSGTARQDSTPVQDTNAVQTDNDENTNTPVNFVLVSQGALSTASTTIEAPFIATDEDTNTNAATAFQTAPLTLTPSQTQTGTQLPTANPLDLLGLIPRTE
jgi:hypothetical protein